MRSSGCQFEKFYGALAKRLCSGLQIRLVRFDSGTRLHFLPWPDGGIGRHKGFKIPRRSRCVEPFLLTADFPGQLQLLETRSTITCFLALTARTFYVESNGLACNAFSKDTRANTFSCCVIALPCWLGRKKIA
ncbi:hypothetical protein L1887_46205 [Cichorium endivia]|nr:hypothetical protein L1887_46205 [Cichorium endivia]